MSGVIGWYDIEDESNLFEPSYDSVQGDQNDEQRTVDAVEEIDSPVKVVETHIRPRSSEEVKSPGENASVCDATIVQVSSAKPPAYGKANQQRSVARVSEFWQSVLLDYLSNLELVEVGEHWSRELYTNVVSYDINKDDYEQALFLLENAKHAEAQLNYFELAQCVYELKRAKIGGRKDRRVTGNIDKLHNQLKDAWRTKLERHTGEL